MSELLGLAERMVEMALIRGADEAEVYIERSRDLSVEIEEGHIACASTTGEHGIGVRLLHDGRLGFASVSRVDDAIPAIEAALRLARSAPKLSFHLPAGGQSGPRLHAMDPRLGQLPAEIALEAADAMVDAWHADGAGTAFSGGGVGLSTSEVAIANHMETGAWDQWTNISASASLVDQKDGISVWKNDASHRNDVDAAAVMARTIETLRSLRNPVDAPWTGACDVLFAPEAASELLTGFVADAVRGDEAKRGNTMWSEHIGDVVANEDLSIYDDPLLQGAVGGCTFDDEGMPAKRIPIVESGVLQGFLYDAWDAARQGEQTTHSAVRGGYGSRPSTGIHHMVFAHRNAVPETKLISGIDQGYFVESVLGAHTANPTTGAFSITAPNVWKIERGEVVGACKEIALGGTVGELLQNVAGASDDAPRMRGRKVPAMWFQNVHVSA